MNGQGLESFSSGKFPGPSTYLMYDDVSVYTIPYLISGSTSRNGQVFHETLLSYYLIIIYESKKLILNQS